MRRHGNLSSKSLRRILSILAVVVTVALLPIGAVFGKGGPAGVTLVLPLSMIPVPEPANLALFVKDKNAAIRLGKALFWDMQAGSDGVQACASCHYRAGADPFNVRAKNQLNPGPDAIFGNNSSVFTSTGTKPTDFRPQFLPNYLLSVFDFPFSRIVPDLPLPFALGTGSLVQDTNDVVGSQGIVKTQFSAVNPGAAVDSGTPIADAVFNIGGGAAGNVRQVTGRNAPSVVNAVFNYTNFWDGRANNVFNGANPFGPLDQGARIWVNLGSAAAPNLVPQQVAIPNASLASQATGPTLSAVEMSFAGRSFPEVGRKMLQPGMVPLGKQLVHPNDSVLAALSLATLLPDGTVTGSPGLKTTYLQMVQAAFQNNLWNTPGTPVVLPTAANPVLGEGFTQAEANFSLFWGLAIQLYEATLVSDRAPFDRFMAGNQNALNAAQLNGLTTFDSKCSSCHSGPELTSASTGSRVPNAPVPVFTNNTTHGLIVAGLAQPLFGAPVTPTGPADAGFFNIGVRPTFEDPGRGGTAPFNNPLVVDALHPQGTPYPLSFTRLALLRAGNQLPFATPVIPLTLSGQPDLVQGSFKVPDLRNVELTPPYFHNGGALTLEQVVAFYTRGGDFGNAELALAVQPLGKLRGNLLGQAEVVEFLKSLTDDRVRNDTAPFDHPQLFLADGDLPQITIPPTGGAPAPVTPVLTIDPIATPTGLTAFSIGGTTDVDAVVSVAVNALAPDWATVGPVAGALPVVPANSWAYPVTGLTLGLNNITVTATSPSGGTATLARQVQILPTAVATGAPLTITTDTVVNITVGGVGVVSYQYSLDGAPFSAETPVATPIVINGLADGSHTLAVLGRDAAGNQQLASTPTLINWTVKATPPVLTLNPVAPTRGPTLTIGGTVDLGLVPAVSTDVATLIGPVTTVAGTGGSTWSCQLSGLQPRTLTITVTATDLALNTTTRTAAVQIVFPDGNLKGAGAVDVTDALKALRIAVQLVQPTALELLHGDVAPLVNGVPAPNGTIGVDDALLILKRSVGLVTW